MAFLPGGQQQAGLGNMLQLYRHSARWGIDPMEGQIADEVAQKVPSGPFMSAARTKAMVRTRWAPRNRRKRRSRRGIIRKRVPRALMPRSRVVRLKVVNTDALSGTGALDGGTIQLNSFDDPFAAAAALQPLGYDQWKALYRKATVLGVKVKQEIYNSGSVPIMCGLNAMPESQGTTLLTQGEHYAELPNSVHRIFSPDVDHGVIFMKASVKKHFGLRKIKDSAEHTMVLPTETPPSRIAYLHYWAQVLDQASEWTCTLVHTVEYIVLLHDPIVPSRSIDS